MLKKKISNIKRKLNGFDSFNYKKISSIRNSTKKIPLINNTRENRGFSVNLEIQKEFPVSRKLCFRGSWKSPISMTILSKNPIENNNQHNRKNNFNNAIITKISVLFLLVGMFVILTNVVFADLYLNSRTGSLIFNTSGIERFRVTSDGLVGIGTTTPNTLLEVNGTVTIGGDLNIPLNDLNVGGGYSGGGISLIGTGTDKGSGQFAKDILIDGAIVAVIDVEINRSFIPVKDLFSTLGNYTRRFLELFVANIKAGNRTLNITGNVSIAQDTLFVDNTSGRVGIGKTDPATALDVSGTVTATGFSGDGSLLTNVAGAGIWNGSGTNIYLNDSTASVGIGTSTPDSKLKVSGDVNITGSLIVQGENITDETNISVLYGWNGSSNVPLRVTGAGVLELSVVEDGTQSTLTAGATGVDLTLTGDLTVDSPTFFVDSSNNRVGILTTSPYNELTIIGSVSISGSLNASSINVTGNLQTDTFNVTQVNENATFQGDVRIIGTLYGSSPLKVGGGLNVTSGDLIFPDGTVQTTAGESSGSGNSTAWNRTGTNVVLSSLTDNVGIGTGSPGMELVVAGNVNVSQNLTVNNSVLFVDGTSGRVGIGTASPTKTLHVVGDVNITGRLDIGILNISDVTFNPPPIFKGLEPYKVPIILTSPLKVELLVSVPVTFM